MKAYQRKAFDDFKRYYHSLDLLLIDDIQFFAGKERTQEEFFNAFEALRRQARRTSSSRATPIRRRSRDIDDRLISRFDSGLTVAIEPPELEMRVAILMQQGAVGGREPAGGRGLLRRQEPALQRARTRRRAAQDPRVIRVPRPRDHHRAGEGGAEGSAVVQNRQISVENIQKTVADFYKIKVADMYSKKRPANIARPRQIAMYLAKELTQKSLPEIGELFGGRDHTTVLHAVRKISAERGNRRAVEPAVARARTDAEGLKKTRLENAASSLCLLTKMPPFPGSGSVLRHNTGLTARGPRAASGAKLSRATGGGPATRVTRLSEGKDGGTTVGQAVTSTKELYATGQDRTR